MRKPGGSLNLLVVGWLWVSFGVLATCWQIFEAIRLGFDFAQNPSPNPDIGLGWYASVIARGFLLSALVTLVIAFVGYSLLRLRPWSTKAVVAISLLLVLYAACGLVWEGGNFHWTFAVSMSALLAMAAYSGIVAATLGRRV